MQINFLLKELYCSSIVIEGMRTELAILFNCVLRKKKELNKACVLALYYD